MRIRFVTMALAIAAAAASWLAWASCSGHHDQLALTNGTAGAGQGGVAGSGAATGAVGGTNGGTAGVGGVGAGEPAGPPKLTVVNGIVDYPAVRLCFVPYPGAGSGGTGGAAGASAVEPWPDASGLDFAAAAPITPTTTVVPNETDVELHVVAGDLSQSVGHSCAALLEMTHETDAGSSLRMASLGVLPQTAFDAERSLLLVTIGCVGGPGHSDPEQAKICGAGYGPDAPTAAVLAGGMSRITDPDRIGMQFAHAAAGMPSMDLRLRTGGAQGPEHWIVQGWSLGAIAPYPPWFELSNIDLGSVAEAMVEIMPTGSTSPTDVTTLPEALEHSDLTAADITDGAGIVFVAVGADPQVPAGSWWHELTYTVVRADP